MQNAKITNNATQIKHDKPAKQVLQKLNGQASRIKPIHIAIRTLTFNEVTQRKEQEGLHTETRHTRESNVGMDMLCSRSPPMKDSL